MASVIKTKRSASTGAPTALAQGEMAYSFLGGTQSNGGDRLYVGTGTETAGEAANIDVIGGKYFTNMLDHVTGTLTASSALLVDANSKVDVLNVDNITLNGNTISTTNTNGDLVLSPNGTGDVSIDTNKSLRLESHVDAAILRFDSSGNIGSSGITLHGGHLDAGALDITTTGKIRFANVYQNEGDLPSASTYHGMFAHVHGTGLAYFAHAGAWHKLIDRTSGVLSNLSNVHTATPSNQQALLYDAGNSRWAPGNLFQVVTADAGTADSVVGTLTFTGGTNINTRVSDNRITIHLDSAVTDLQSITVDNVKIDGSNIGHTSDTDLLTLASNSLTVAGALTVSGDFTVNGTTTTVNSTTVQVDDKNLLLGDASADSSSMDGGGITLNTNHVKPSLTYVASTDRWNFNKKLNVPTAGLLLNNVTLAETIDDQVGSLATAGEGIDITYNDGAGTLTFAGENATKNNLGIASFDSAHFGITSGHISLPTVDGGTY